MDNKITIADMKYFNMEKELSLKKTELKDAFVKHQKELVRNSRGYGPSPPPYSNSLESVMYTLPNVYYFCHPDY